MSAVEVQIHLSELLVERALASIEGLATDGAYMADLDDEIAATHHGPLRASEAQRRRRPRACASSVLALSCGERPPARSGTIPRVSSLRHGRMVVM
jgi:hypothetical protein